MRNRPTRRSFRPELEYLEDRRVLSSSSPLSLHTLNGLLDNLNNNTNNFKTQQSVLAGYESNPPLSPPGPGGTKAVIETGLIGDQYTRTAETYQQMVIEQFTIDQAVSKAVPLMTLGSLAISAKLGNYDIAFATIFFVAPQYKKIETSANNQINSVNAQASQTYSFAELYAMLSNFDNSIKDSVKTPSQSSKGHGGKG
jgi:hypothetical protein